MSSRIIGRAPCPECGFAAAHVKQSDKCTYRYCPECHSQTFARTERQVEQMRKAMQPVAPVAAPAAAAELDEPAPAAGGSGTGTAPALPVAPVVAVAAARRPLFSGSL